MDAAEPVTPDPDPVAAFETETGTEAESAPETDRDLVELRQLEVEHAELRDALGALERELAALEPVVPHD